MTAQSVENWLWIVPAVLLLGLFLFLVAEYYDFEDYTFYNKQGKKRYALSALFKVVRGTGYLVGFAITLMWGIGEYFRQEPEGGIPLIPPDPFGVDHNEYADVAMVDQLKKVSGE